MKLASLVQGHRRLLGMSATMALVAATIVVSVASRRASTYEVSRIDMANSTQVSKAVLFNPIDVSQQNEDTVKTGGTVEAPAATASQPPVGQQTATGGSAGRPVIAKLASVTPIGATRIAKPAEALSSGVPLTDIVPSDVAASPMPVQEAGGVSGGTGSSGESLPGKSAKNPTKLSPKLKAALLIGGGVAVATGVTVPLTVGQSSGGSSYRSPAAP